ncbi:MAG TPA: hypothetical protein ENI26_11955 [Methylophaga aminisulfidivorans]|uniref:Uncharacterized protein n=2 Tax=Methylophaga TaxID=40222 RepID=A0A1I4C3G0_9GAMM|nr:MULTISPECIES: hypothetical protein [Methylophaga]WVI83719.1 hypothetical protein VSX76_01330 [Methylophaga thalassica]SFK75622.1 hypothetical protein SAMN04488079_12419 [Methylophaga sulfidovorans]HEC75064.1 hypothetical protein [Methylophaga aminisulfidivorans]
MKVLQILDQAFRTVVEEQDETILWLIQCMQKKVELNDIDQIQLLLTGQAVYYTQQKKQQPPLKIGDWLQTQPANINKDIDNLISSHIPVYVVYEDLWDRGLEMEALREGIQVVNREQLVPLFEQADQIWHW